MIFDEEQLQELAMRMNYSALHDGTDAVAVLEVRAVRVIEVRVENGQLISGQQLREQIAESFRQSTAQARDAGIQSIEILEKQPS